MTYHSMTFEENIQFFNVPIQYTFCCQRPSKVCRYIQNTDNYLDPVESRKAMKTSIVKYQAIGTWVQA